jgi:queuosine precursor transporter
MEATSPFGAKRYSTWFVIIVGFFIACLIASNIVAVKLIAVFGLVLPAAVVIFPLS